MRGCGRNREEGDPNEDECLEFVVDSVASVALLELLHASDDSLAESESRDGKLGLCLGVSTEVASLPMPS